MHLSVTRCLALSAALVLCGLFGQRAHAQSTEVRTVTLRVAADESYRAGAEWEADLRRTVQIVSDIYEKQFQIRFAILDVVPFTAPSQASMHRYAPLNRLQSMATAVPIGEAELLIGLQRRHVRKSRCLRSGVPVRANRGDHGEMREAR